MIISIMQKPAISTFIEATVRGYLDCLPHLTVCKICRNKPYNIATSLGHQDHTRKNYKSTKPIVGAQLKRPVPKLDSMSDALDTFPILEPVSMNTIYNTKKVQRTDQHYFMESTGRFSVKSRAGNEYNLVIMYNYDANYDL